MSSSSTAPSGPGSYYDPVTDTNIATPPRTSSVKLGGWTATLRTRLAECTDKTFGSTHFIRDDEKFLLDDYGRKFCSSCATRMGTLEHELEPATGGGVTCSHCGVGLDSHAPHVYRSRREMFCVSCATGSQPADRR